MNNRTVGLCGKEKEKAAFEEGTALKCVPASQVPNLLFREYMLYWFYNIFRERVVSATYVCWQYTLLEYVLPYLPKVKVRLISARHIDAVTQAVTGKNKHAAYRAYSLLYAAMDDAVRSRYIVTDPMAYAVRHRRPKSSITIPDEQQIEALLRAAKNEYIFLEIALAMFCGLRRGEIYGLKFSDIDFEAKTLQIRRQRTARYQYNNGRRIRVCTEEAEPKSERSRRTLHIPDIVVELLQKRRARCGGSAYDGYVSVNQKDNAPYAVNSLNKALTKVCEKAGIPKLSVHALRHVFASLLIEQGAALEEISAMLGHKNTDITFGIYCDIIAHDGKIADTVDAIYRGGDEGDANRNISA